MTRDWHWSDLDPNMARCDDCGTQWEMTIDEAIDDGACPECGAESFMFHGVESEDATAQEKVRADIETFRRAVATAPVEYVGEDHEYVPDSPRLQEQMGVGDE